MTHLSPDEQLVFLLGLLTLAVALGILVGGAIDAFHAWRDGL